MIYDEAERFGAGGDVRATLRVGECVPRGAELIRTRDAQHAANLLTEKLPRCCSTPKANYLNGGYVGPLSEHVDGDELQDFSCAETSHDRGAIGDGCRPRDNFGANARGDIRGADLVGLFDVRDERKPEFAAGEFEVMPDDVPDELFRRVDGGRQFELVELTRRADRNFIIRNV